MERREKIENLLYDMLPAYSRFRLTKVADAIIALDPETKLRAIEPCKNVLLADTMSWPHDERCSACHGSGTVTRRLTIEEITELAERFVSAWPLRHIEPLTLKGARLFLQW